MLGTQDVRALLGHITLGTPLTNAQANMNGSICSHYKNARVQS